MSKPLFSDEKSPAAVVVEENNTVDRVANVSSIVYHEARHAEQLFNVARLLAGKKQTGDDIKKTMDIKNESVVSQALASPIGASDPKAATAETHFQSIFGKGAAERHKLLKALEFATAKLMQAKLDAEQARKDGADAATRRAKNAAETEAKREQRGLEGQYRALPEEADAFAVQDQVKELFVMPSG